MNITNSMLETFMQLATNRQQVIADNIAKNSLPGYLAKDTLMPSTFTALLQSDGLAHQLQLFRTSSAHIKSNRSNSKFKTVLDKDAVELKPNGNNISLAQQAQKASQNQIAYNQALTAYHNSNNLYSIAIGKGK